LTAVSGDGLRKLQSRSGEFDTLLLGHGEPRPASFLAAIAFNPANLRARK
jgi:hypothetical protein